MQRFYSIALIVLILTSVMMLIEMFDVVIPPVWLSQVNGLLLLLSVFIVTYIRVRRTVPVHR